MKDDSYWKQKIKEQPKRYIPTYSKGGELVEVYDSDTGYTWVKTKEGNWVTIG